MRSGPVGRCCRPDGSTCRSVLHVCWLHPVLWQLLPQSQWHRLASSSPVSLRVRHWRLVQIPSPAAQRQQDRGNLVCLQVETQQAEYGQHVCSSRIRDNPTVSRRVVRDLGLHFVSELSMKHHVAKAAVCFYHLPRLQQIRWRLGTEVTIWLVLAVVISRLDYCNSVLADVPLATLALLQRVSVQNAFF